MRRLSTLVGATLATLVLATACSESATEPPAEDPPTGPMRYSVCTRLLEGVTADTSRYRISGTFYYADREPSVESGLTGKTWGEVRSFACSTHSVFRANAVGAAMQINVTEGGIEAQLWRGTEEQFDSWTPSNRPTLVAEGRAHAVGVIRLEHGRIP